MNRTLTLVFCAALMIMLSLPDGVRAQLPRQISYQGVLTDGISGKPLAGTHTLTLRLYDTPTAEKPLWIETHTASVENGLFNLTLGVNTPLLLPFDRVYYIGMSINGAPELSRVPLTAAPYSLQAEAARSLTPNATGAVTSLNGKEGNLTLRGDDGLEVRPDAEGGLVIGKSSSLSKAETTLGDGTEWLLAGNAATSGNFLGTTNSASLIIKTNNGERMRVLATGNVGIGETAPASRLAVAGSIQITNTGGTPELKLSESSGSNYTAFRTGVQSSDIIYTLPLTAGGNGDVLTTNGSGVLSWMGADYWKTAGNSDITSADFLGTSNNQPLIVKTNNTERFRVTGAGFMGINETNPTQKLEVGGNVVIKPAGMSNSGELRFMELSGYNYTAFHAGTQAANITYTLPAAAPTENGQVLQSTVEGTMSWAAPQSVPAGFMISGTSSSAPAGYTYTGIFFMADSLVWTAKADMPTARSQPGTAVVSGKIYAIGGFNGTFLGVNEEYTPASNTWATKTSMPTPRRGFGCEAVNNRIYALMGYDSTVVGADSLAEEYNPATDTWQSKAKNTGSCRLMSFGAATVNGVIYCLGGSSGGDGQFSTCSSVQHKYNVNTNTWDTVRVQDGFAYFWFNGTQACVVNNKIYFGGARFDNPAALSEYDPATKTFIRDITQFPGGHRYQGMVAIGNDIYVVGGNTGGGKAYGTPASALARTDIYNLTSGTWKAGPNLPTPAWGCGAVVLNGKIYIVGGHNSTTYLANLQELTVAQKAVYFHAKN